MEHGSRTRLVTALVLAVVFGSGVLLGYAADTNVGPEPSDAAVAPQEGGDRQGDAERRRRTPVYEQLHPTQEQEALIDSILREHRVRMNKLHEDFRSARAEYRSNYDALIRETREEIAGVFSPEQAAEYRKLLVDFDQRRADERSSRDDRK